MENQECVENDENIQKTKHKGLRVNFDHLSIVSEENTTNSDSTNAHDECSGRSDQNSSSKYDATMELTSESTTTGDTVLLNGGWDFSIASKAHPNQNPEQNALILQSSDIVADNINPNCSPAASNHMNSPNQNYISTPSTHDRSGYARGGPDIFVQNFHNASSSVPQTCQTICSFQTHGNIEELLKNIEQAPGDVQFQPFATEIGHSESSNLTRYRSEINVFLQNSQEVATPPIIPEPMMLLPKLLPYIGFENLVDMPIVSSGLETPQLQTPIVMNAQASNGILPSSTSTHVMDNASIPASPPCDVEKPNISNAIDASEAAQNEQNSEHLKIKTQSPATRRRLYSANNKLSVNNDRSGPMPPDTYHASRQRLGSISSSSEKNELKTEPAKKSRRVSIYFSGRKKNSSKKNHSKDPPVVPGEINDHPKITDSRRMSKLKVSDSCRSTSSKTSRKGKSVHEGSGPHSSIYSTQESCPEGTTSHSERNSVASSRESSTSLSMRSHRSHRKLSAGSMHNGNIPWCGCWGNGCL